MNSVIKVIKNYLILLPQVKYLAKKHHRTGANNDAKIVAERLDILLNVISHQHTMSRGEEEIFNVAELGTSQTFDLIAKVLRHAKATQAFACDVGCYFPTRHSESDWCRLYKSNTTLEWFP